MVKKQSQYVFLYRYMDLWIKHDLENGANYDQVLFDFGNSPLEAQTQDLAQTIQQAVGSQSP